MGGNSNESIKSSSSDPPTSMNESLETAFSGNSSWTQGASGYSLFNELFSTLRGDRGITVSLTDEVSYVLDSDFYS